MAEINNLYNPPDPPDKLEELKPEEPIVTNFESKNEEPTQTTTLKDTDRDDFYDLYLTKPSKQTERYANDYKKIDKSKYILVSPLNVY